MRDLRFAIPSQILALAQKDPVCMDTVNIFCGIMGEYAGSSSR